MEKDGVLKNAALFFTTDEECYVCLTAPAEDCPRS
jgi:hypothetical protein